MKKLKYILACLLIFGITTANAQIENLKQIRVSDFSGGMVSNSVRNSLQPNQAASMVNVQLNIPGRVFKRKGQDLFNQDTGSTAFTGIGRFDPDATTSYLVAASGTQVIRATSNATSWTVANPSNPLTPGLTTEFVQANDLLFVLNGFDSTPRYNGATWTAGGAYPTNPPAATTGAWLRNYLFLAGATSESDWLYFSNNLAPATFSASDIVKINTGDGQAITHLEPFRLNELIIYKERSIFVLDVTGTTPLTDWTVQPITTAIGTDSPRTVVNLGNDQWFLSSEPFAVRSLTRTNFDKILVNHVSQAIQDVFDGTGILTLNTNQVEKAAAVLFDNKYVLAIATGTSTVNNTVFVYDFLVNAWYQINGWFPADWVVFDNRLFYIDANDGRVIECFAGTTGDWAEGPNTIDDASTPTVAVAFTYQTRALDFEAPENFKQLDSIEVEFFPTGDYTAEIFINLDNDGWESIGTINLAGNSLTLPITLPSQLQNDGISRKTFQLSSSGEFKEMQVMVQQNGLTEQVKLQRVTVFARVKPWRRQ